MKNQNLRNTTKIKFLIQITVTIILIIVLIPTYYYYSRQMAHKEITRIARHYQTAVTQCLKKRKNNVFDCNAGKYGIPDNMNESNTTSSKITSVTVVNGVITITPAHEENTKTHSIYVLTPKITPQGISWIENEDEP